MGDHKGRPYKGLVEGVGMAEVGARMKDGSPPSETFV